jgi:hypothetical protein
MANFKTSPMQQTAFLNWKAKPVERHIRPVEVAALDLA